METKEVILKCYQDWQETQERIFSTTDFNKLYNEQQKRAMFLSDGVIGIATYDSDLDLDFGEMILETMLHITNCTTYQYIEDAANYKKYIQSANYILSMLEWGSSIRGAWFDAFHGTLKIDMPVNIPELNGYEYEIQFNEEILTWFLAFLQDKVN